MENLTIGKMLNVFKQNTRIILLFSVIGLAVGLLYSTTFFKPTYKSKARLLIKNPEQQNFVTELGTNNGITPLTRNGNPSLTQMQILTSTKLASEVWQAISAKYQFKDNLNLETQLMQKAINTQNPVGTDIIEITASWTSPDIAHDIANAFVAAYIADNINVSKNSLTQSKSAIDKELAAAEKNLLAVRDNIRRFREANSTVNIDVESENIVAQISNLENRYNEIISLAGAEGNRVNSIAQRLGIDWKKAIDSVALGHNTNITAMQT
ncbi:MAG: Wzz/FepE/Etk N-terminal domain-containing protein [Desulfobacterales bacterium]|nr:Wzz/FepE/Etk N-terminal domain-containing protein [Desulfobacterales bacterium]